jgi:hypothetical protein
MILGMDRVTISTSGVCSRIVWGSDVITSRILLACVRTYSAAKRPFPRKNSSQLGLRRIVPVSARRKRSLSVTIQTSLPEASRTGSG